jgi:hypothetical protein
MHKGLAVARIQVPPFPFLAMVVKRGRLAALGTKPLRIRRMFDPNIDSVGRNIKLHFSNSPWMAQVQQSCIQIGIFHLGPLSNGGPEGTTALGRKQIEKRIQTMACGKCGKIPPPFAGFFQASVEIPAS